MEIPKQIVAGDSVQWVDVLEDYQSPDWSMVYALRNSAGSIDIASSAGDDGTHLFSLDAATTSVYTPGLYYYQVYAVFGSERKTVGRGVVHVKADFSSTASYDARPWLDRAIDAVEASLAGRASSVQLRMEIDGSTIEHVSHLDQLELLERLYKRRAARARARDIASGKSPFGTVRVEF